MPAKQEKIIASDCAHLQKLIDEAIRRDGPNCDLNYIDVSNIYRMEALFKNSPFNGDISQWNVSKVVNMKDMFCNSQFNGDISKWNVSNVTDMSGMFKNSVFNHSIAEWDVSNVTNMSGMFKNSVFNQGIAKWNVSNVSNMREMFCKSQFDRDLDLWNVSGVQYMQKMFCESRFCKYIGKWNVSNVKSMEKMFFDTPYNMDISEWNISRDCQRKDMFSPEQKNILRDYFKGDYYRKLKNTFPDDFRCMYETQNKWECFEFAARPVMSWRSLQCFQNDNDKSIFSYTFLFHLIAYIALKDESYVQKTISEETLKKFGTKTGWLYLGYEIWFWLSCSRNNSKEKFHCNDLKTIIRNFDLVNGIGVYHNFVREYLFEKLNELLKEDMQEFGIPNDSAKRVLESIDEISPKVLNALSRLKV